MKYKRETRRWRHTHTQRMSQTELCSQRVISGGPDTLPDEVLTENLVPICQGLLSWDAQWKDWIEPHPWKERGAQPQASQTPLLLCPFRETWDSWQVTSVPAPSFSQANTFLILHYILRLSLLNPPSFPPPSLGVSPASGLMAILISLSPIYLSQAFSPYTLGDLILF